MNIESIDRKPQKKIEHEVASAPVRDLQEAAHTETSAEASEQSKKGEAEAVQTVSSSNNSCLQGNPLLFERSTLSQNTDSRNTQLYPLLSKIFKKQYIRIG